MGVAEPVAYLVVVDGLERHLCATHYPSYVRGLLSSMGYTMTPVADAAGRSCLACVQEGRTPNPEVTLWLSPREVALLARAIRDAKWRQRKHGQATVVAVTEDDWDGLADKLERACAMRAST